MGVCCDKCNFKIFENPDTHIPDDENELVIDNQKKLKEEKDKIAAEKKKMEEEKKAWQ